MAVENPPLWMWAIVIGVIGAIIAAKFTYRWYSTKQLARQSQKRNRTG